MVVGFSEVAEGHVSFVDFLEEVAEVLLLNFSEVHGWGGAN